MKGPNAKGQVAFLYVLYSQLPNWQKAISNIATATADHAKNIHLGEQHNIFICCHHNTTQILIIIQPLHEAHNTKTSIFYLLS